MVDIYISYTALVNAGAVLDIYDKHRYCSYMKGNVITYG
jgi:hypothetical protein